MERDNTLIGQSCKLVVSVCSEGSLSGTCTAVKEEGLKCGELTGAVEKMVGSVCGVSLFHAPVLVLSRTRTCVRPRKR